MRATILSLAVILLGLSSVAAQGPTLRQLAIEHKGQASSSGLGLGDVEITPEQIIMQRLVVSSTRPGPMAAMVFKTRGGTVVFDGYPFTVSVESNGRRVNLEAGDRAVLFGSYDSTDGKWLLTPIGVFDVEDNVVLNELPAIEPFTETWPERMPINMFADRIRSLAARLR